MQSLMDLDGFSKTIPTRPNCWSFDFSSLSTTSSGYCSAENSTESETPPFDWDSVCDKLENLENLQVTIQTDDERQYSMNDCYFSVKIRSDAPTTNFSKYLNTMETYVEGPTGRRYEVSQSPGNSASTLICTFRPLECGPFTCHVKLFQSQFSDPEPLVMYIDRKYGTATAITSLDIEVSEEDGDMGKLRVRKPWGICSNSRTEQIYVADRELHEILVYGPDGEFEFRFGGKGQTEGKFFRPTAIVYDNTYDRILVADKDNHRIQIFSPEGKYLKSFGRKGSYTGQFFFPWGIAVSRDGRYIAVADSRNHRIQLFDHEGRYLRKYSTFDRKSTAYKKEFDYPRGISFDLKGENLFVTDFNLHSLFKLPLDLSSCTKILTADCLRRPQGIVVNDAGNILLCDSRNNSIKVISDSGQLLQEFTTIGKSRPMEIPLDIEVMKGGYIALLDLNGRIRIF